MSAITLRVLDGADRGRVYDDLVPPITIGREEGNSIQLNDERVSRFHLKIQEDRDKLVLTDLESTNGTKVNGETIQLRILRHGDLISVGRSMLVFGTRTEIAERLRRLNNEPTEARASASVGSGSSLDVSDDMLCDPLWPERLRELSLPGLPEHLSPGQAAQLAEMLEFLHSRIRYLLTQAHIDETSEHVELNASQWQQLVDLQSRLSEFLRAIGEPDF